MKILLYFLCILAFFACSEAPYKLYDGAEHIQLDGKYKGFEDGVPLSFYYLDKETVQDTFLMKVFTIGNPKPFRRKVNFVQVKEFKVEYVVDKFGYVIDTIYTEYLNKAVSGTHYIPFDDSRVADHYYIEADEVSAEFPIICLRDSSLKEGGQRLAIRLVDSELFKVGEVNSLDITIVMTDKLSKPIRWDAYISRYVFGEYSTRKHEFMVEVSGEKVDTDWMILVLTDMSATSFYQAKFKDALVKYNNDLENIANNLTPMREDQDDENSPIVEFK